ncbi:MAG: type II toxin-antitoxin system VapC family toxin [Alphaproteobacteria bacterium]|nr:type II toxin-antitoxin system VapC family toxin [Alphaproteobacteria bacterium]
MYLLDTNVISELRKAHPHGAVTAWLSAIPADRLRIAAVTLGEMQAGVELARERNPEKADEIEAWVDLVARTWNVLPMDGVVFRAWARLMHRQSDTLIQDAMIAATAIVHDLVVVTRNARDFKPFGVTVLDPFPASRPRV